MTELKIGITYHFEQHYLPTKRHKNQEIRDMVCTYDAKVKVLEENEFPVALKVTDYGYYNKGAAEYALGTTEIRVFDGRLWKLNAIESGENRGTPIPVDSLSDSLNPAPYDRHYYHKNPYEEGVSIIVDDNKDMQEAEIEERAGNAVIFNNTLWIPSGQPYYYLDCSGFSDSIYLTVKWSFEEKVGYQDYLAGQERQLNDKISRVIASRRKKENNYKDVKIELIIPEAYTLKRERASGDVEGYFYDDEEKRFVKEYLGDEPTVSEKYRVKFNHGYQKYLAEVYVNADYSVYDKRLIWLIVGQLMEDVRDLKFEDIKEIYSVDHKVEILKPLNDEKGISA